MQVMISLGRRRGAKSHDNLSWVAWANAAYFAVQSVNLDAVELSELAQLAGIETKTEEKKEAV